MQVLFQILQHTISRGVFMLNNILYIGFFFGILGTFIGGLIGVFIKFKSNKTLSCILEFAARINARRSFF